MRLSAALRRRRPAALSLGVNDRLRKIAAASLRASGSTALANRLDAHYVRRSKQYLPDPGEIRYRDDLGSESLFHYRVVRIWEVDPRTVLRLATPHLLPLAPLMRTPDPVATMLESMEAIRGWNPDLAPPSKKADLQAALAVYSGLVIEDDMRSS